MYWVVCLVQMLIVSAVGCIGIYYEWTPNGLLLGLIGIGAAYCLTVLPLKLWLRFHAWRLRRLPTHKSARYHLD